MIPFGRGKAVRRVGAFCCALLLLLQLALFPVQARAASLLTPQVGWAETVSSFMMSCGIYPYDKNEDGTYNEWTLSGIKPIWDKFQQDVTDISYDIVDMAGYLTKGAIAITRNRWNVLRSFVTWLTDTYSLSDSQSYEIYSDGSFLPYNPSYSNSNLPTESAAAGGALIYSKSVNNIDYDNFFLANVPRVIVCSLTSGTYTYLTCVSDVSGYYFIGSKPYAMGNGDGNSLSAARSITTEISSSGRVAYVSGAYPISSSFEVFNTVPVSSLTVEAFLDAYYGPLVKWPSLLMGIDTTTISVPDVIPSGSEYGTITMQTTDGTATVTNITLNELQAALEAAVKGGIELGLRPTFEVGTVSPDDAIEVQVYSTTSYPTIDLQDILPVFLMTSGIYLANSDPDNTTYDDWLESALPAIIQQYETDTATDFPDINGFLVDGTVVLPSNTWDDLQLITDWIVNTYELSDNSSDVPIGSGTNITVTTTTISVPESLPTGTDWGGLTIGGAGDFSLPTLGEVVKDVIQSVTDGDRPLIGRVPVTISPDIVINEKGELARKEVTVENIPLVASNYMLDVTSKFPFSLPWDIYRVLNVLNATPTRPEWDVNVYVPILDVHVPFHIGIPDEVSEDVDAFMSLWRGFLLILMCVGTLIFIRNLIR